MNRKDDAGPSPVRTTARAPNLEIPYESCLAERLPDACTIVILGASGDLTARKLMPALYSLYRKGCLPDSFHILGCSRTPWTAENFRDRMKESLPGKADLSSWPEFVASLSYLPLDYDDLPSFRRLASYLKEFGRGKGLGDNLIFYLAVPPAVYGAIARMLGRAGLAAEGKVGDGWSRIVVEKPFGHDLESAIELDSALHEHFQERQIFRIDHYLAKETVQNILMFRFANAIFEPVWNRRYIERVKITAAESIGIEHRAGYYDRSGVLRDMFQNHMMQLLALTALEPPSQFEANRVQDEKVKVYRSLQPFPVDRLKDYIVLGQYAPGEINGEAVPAYVDEEGVAPDSLTPTYATMKVFIDNWRWQGVPFFLTSGKRLAEKITSIAIDFREVPHSMFRKTLGAEISANRLTLGIYPEEKITLTFQTKNPGARVRLRAVTMDFFYQQNYEGPVLDAYEKVLIDCMLGDRMLFLREDGVELCWSFLTPILKECETCGDRAEMLLPYQAGSWGPEAVARLGG